MAQFMQEGGQKSEAQIRKDRPLARGVLDYFPDALLAVAEVSSVAGAGNVADGDCHGIG